MQKELVQIFRFAIRHFRDVRSAVSDIEAVLVKQAFFEQIPIPEFPGQEKRAEFARFLADLKYEQLRVVYPNILWSSMFLSSYSALENLLDSLCDFYQSNRSLAIEPSDLKDQGITRSRKYLTKVANIVFPDSSLAWKEIENSGPIRNCLVHANGIVSQTKNSQSVTRFCEAHKNDIHIDSDRLIVLKAFPISFSQWCYDFVTELLNAN